MQHQKETASVKTRLLVSWVYMVDFLNLDEDGGERTRFRVALFYVVVFIENVLLVSLWSTNIRKDKHLRCLHGDHKEGQGLF